MSGAFSFLSALFFGAAAVGVSAYQESKIVHFPESFGYRVDLDPEVEKMRKRVYKEAQENAHGYKENAANKKADDYDAPDRCCQERLWLKEHLDIKGIPYDLYSLNEASGVNDLKRKNYIKRVRKREVIDDSYLDDFEI